MSRSDRRKFIALALCAPAAAMLTKAAASACVDPEELSDSVQGMRDSLEYADKASDPKQACNGCSFFNAQKAGDGCGHCEVLGGPVSAAGHCVSWTKRS